MDGQIWMIEVNKKLGILQFVLDYNSSVRKELTVHEIDVAAVNVD